ncbi:sigma factor regulatory protein, FecR/PupR family [Leptospira ryugenii]|uniref:Sigma factor regulatory protein, FecR/PupR family n=1 Tax=Leptospira ryugenii TaxID=1917863 RepID=A0A2P2E3P2_9LEPT|nr:sigma factor regulatory protein, FecR/PupR family [Leptospira ryugenii]
MAGFIKGKVNILSANDSSKLWKALKVNDVIQPGDTIKTGNGSKVDLVFKDSEFRLQPNTTFVLKEWDPKKQVSKAYVENGAAWFRAKDFKKGSFEVSSPTSTAGVRGTAFGVYYMPKEKKTYTCVCEGKVDVNGQVFEKGMGASVGTDEAIERNEYKDIISKEGANLAFQKKMQTLPMLSQCLACHKPIGWEAKDRIPDEKYGK